jgi:putative ABC transport system ATP-binding protein
MGEAGGEAMVGEAARRRAPDPATGSYMVLADEVSRTYRTGRVEVPALRGVNLTAAAGTLVAVRGRSGSGKTTLLNVLGGLDRPDGGRVLVDGRDVTAMSEGQLRALRRDVIGFVFQSFGLIPILSAAENVGVPMRLAGADPAEREERVRTLLDLVGLGAHAGQRPYELSGGQQQRVAVARALANSPRLLIADEPTAQLDSQTGRGVMRLLVDLVHEQGVTAVVATHDPALTELADQVIELRDGRAVAAS